MDLKNFDGIVERAKSGKKFRAIIAGSDAENILKGAFRAQDEGFVTPILVGPRERTQHMLERLGLADKPFELVESAPGDNVTQMAVDMIKEGRGDILMRGNIQTREFLLPLLDKKNGMLRKDWLLTHVALVSMPEYPKVIAIGDVTVTIRPNPNQKKQIIRNMTGVLKSLGVEKPNLALLSLVEQVSFHMRDTVEAFELVKDHRERPIADCNLVGPIAYDLILSQEAARLKGYDCPYCGQFDGIVAPELMVANIIVKGWQMHAHAVTCGVMVGAKVPVAVTSRSDDPEVAFNSLACCAALPERPEDIQV